MIKDSFSWGQNVPMKVRLYVKIVQLELKEGTNCTPVGMNGFQRYKLNASNSQLTLFDDTHTLCCFKEQRYKLNASNSQPAGGSTPPPPSCFKEQRYKLNASNSQPEETRFNVSLVVSKSKDTS